MKPIIFLALIGLHALFLPTVRSEEDAPKPDPIDLKIRGMMASNPSTRGAIHAYQEAHRLWEAEMNTLLDRLNQRLPVEQRRLLQQSQTDWAKCRDSEEELRTSFFATRRGTMWGPIALEARAAVVRARALTLRGYLRLAGG